MSTYIYFVKHAKKILRLGNILLPFACRQQRPSVAGRKPKTQTDTMRPKKPYTKPTPNPDFSAKFGYFITRSRSLGDSCPLGVIDENGEYDSEGAMPGESLMAVYPSKDLAQAAIKRAAGDSDPVVFDGLYVHSLRHTKMHDAHECISCDWVCYPDGKPARTDYESDAFLFGPRWTKGRPAKKAEVEVK